MSTPEELDCSLPRGEHEGDAIGDVDARGCALRGDDVPLVDRRCCVIVADVVVVVVGVVNDADRGAGVIGDVVEGEEEAPLSIAV